MFRWTREQLETFTTKELIRAFLEERKSTITNVHAPLNKEIKKVQAWVEKNMPDGRLH
jgi:hypothetical protein